MATAKRHRSARKGRQGVVRLSAAFLRMTQHGSASADLDPKGAPFGQRGRAPLLVNLPGDEVSFLIEMVVNLGVYRAELLQRLHAAKPLPRSRLGRAAPSIGRDRLTPPALRRAARDYHISADR
jgi:hypothetical protein